MNGRVDVLAGTELPAVRRSWIIQRLTQAGMVRTQDLSDDLRVSVETIRRDLATLECEGVLERVHGGATTVGYRLSEEPSFQDRTRLQEPAKLRIGQAAVGLIHNQSTIFLDLGTTALCVALALPKDFRGIVVTNSLSTGVELSKRPHIRLLVTGGPVRGGDLSMSGQHAVDMVENMRADVAFIGSGGVHPSAGLTDFYLEEITIRQAMMRNSAKSYVLADSSKFSRIAPFHVADWDSFAGLITDQEPPSGLRTAVVSAGGSMIVAA